MSEWIESHGYEKPFLPLNTKVYYRLKCESDYIHGPTAFEYLDWTLSKAAPDRITHYKIFDPETKPAEKSYDLANDRPLMQGAF